MAHFRERAGRLQSHSLAVSAALLLVILVGTKLVPGSGPGTYALGVVFGAGTGLAAMGVVLVYRSTRVINFAQVQLGAVTGALFTELIRHQYIAAYTLTICPDCALISWLRAAAYWASMAVSLLAAPVAGLLVFAFLRLLARAPRYVSTVATLAIGGALTAFATSVIPGLFNQNSNALLGIGGVDLTPPLHVSIPVGGLLLNFGQAASAIAGVAAVGVVFAFLRFTRAGRAVRATAEDRERAATLGINEALVQAQVWLLAGTLGGIAALLQSMASGSSGAGNPGAGVVVRVLVASILAGLESAPLALLGAIVLASLDQAFFAGFTNTSLVDGVLFLVVLVALLLRPRGAATRYDPDAAVWRVVREVRPTPVQLKNLAVVRRWRFGLLLSIAALLLGLPFISAPGDLENYTTLVIYGMVGLSLLLVAGWAGQISLGQFGFVGVGGYVAAVLTAHQHLPLPVALVAGALAGTVVAVVVGLPSLRIRGLYLAVTSLAFALAVSSILITPSLGGKLLPDRLDRPIILGLDLEDEKVFYYLCIAVAAIVVIGVLGMRRSRTGRAVIATRDNEKAAQSLGIAPVLARVEIFAMSGFIAALAGALFAFEQHGVRVGSYSPEVSEQMFLMVIVGGLGAVSGPLLGAAFLGLLPLFASLNPAGPAIGTAAVIVFLLANAPGGLVQVVFQVRDSFLRRVAERYRVDVPSLIGARQGEVLRIPIAPRVLRGGGTPFVPVRYRLPGLPRIRKPSVNTPAVRR